MSYLVQMAGAGGAELRVGGGRHRRRDCADPRLRAARDEHDRELLGRHDARDAATCCCRSPSSPRWCSCSQGVDPELPPVHGRQDGRRRDADDRAGTRGVAGSHQAARHERRRLLQRQLGAPVREPDAVHESRSDPADLRPRRGPHLHVRPHGQGHAPGLGALLGDGGHVPAGRLRRLSGRAGGQSDAGEAGRRERSDRRAAGREHGRQGDALRDRASRRCSPR